MLGPSLTCRAFFPPFSQLPQRPFNWTINHTSSSSDPQNICHEWQYIFHCKQKQRRDTWWVTLPENFDHVWFCWKYKYSCWWKWKNFHWVGQERCYIFSFHKMCKILIIPIRQKGRRVRLLPCPSKQIWSLNFAAIVSKALTHEKLKWNGFKVSVILLTLVG